MLNVACQLLARSLLFVRGGDRYDFLQPLISNDLQAVKNGDVIWAAHLTPQGKFACDLLIGSFEDVVIIETESDFIKDFHDILQKLKLRADVEFAFGDSFKVWSLPKVKENRYDYGMAFSDVRDENLGYRFWGRDEDFATLQKHEDIKLVEDDNDYHALRIGSFVPENSQRGYSDLIRGKTLLLEAGFDSLGGIDWEKGCYVGQELTARTKYRGLVKKCLVQICSDEPFANNEIHDSANSVIGDIRSRAMTAEGKHIALAGMRLADLDKDIFCGTAKLQIIVPDFLHRA